MRTVILSVLVLGLPMVLWGGEVEDARKLVDEKKYDEADKLLEKVLAQKEPPADALRVSLDAALARGRTVTAQQRITSLLKATQNQDLNLVFLGAQIAEQSGDERLALARYLAYSKAATQKDEKAEQALRYVLWRGAYPEEYRKYLDLFGKTDISWDLGQRQISALLAVEESAQALSVAEVLLANATSPSQVQHVYGLLWDAQEKGLLGGDPEQRYVRPLDILLKAKPLNQTVLDNFITQRLWGWDKFNAEQRSELMFRVQEMWKGRLGWNLLSRFECLRSIQDEGRRLSAGKRYLSYENYYKNDPDPNAYREYLHCLVDSPQVFCIQGKELVKPEDIASRFEVIRAKFGGDGNEMNYFFSQILNNCIRDPKAQAEFLRKHLAVLPPDKAAMLAGLGKPEDVEAFIGEACKGRDGGWISNFKGSLLPVLNQMGKKDALIAAAKDWTQTQPGNFNWQHLQGHFINSLHVSLEEKLAVLRELLEKAGPGGPLRALIHELDKDKKTWGQQAAFQQFKQEQADGSRQGSDLFMRTHLKLYSLPYNRGGPPKTYLETAQKFLEEAPKDLPTGDWKQDALLGGICWRHFDAVWDNRGEIEKAARLWSPRLKKGFAWSFMAQRVREHGGNDTLFQMARMYIEDMKDSPGDSWVWYNLSQAVSPKGSTTALFAGLHDKVGPANVVSYLMRQGNLELAVIFDELTKLAVRPDFPFGNLDLPREIAQFVFQRTNNQNKPPVELTQALWKCFSASEEQQHSYDPGTEVVILGQLTRAERWDEWAAKWKEYQAFLQKRSSREQVQALACLTGVLPREKAGELTSGARAHTLLKELGPRLMSLHPAEWPHLVFFQDFADDLTEIAGRWPEGDARNEGAALLRRGADVLVAGARYEGRGWPVIGLLQMAAEDALAKGEWERLSRLTQGLAGQLSRENEWEKLFKECVQPLAAKLKEKEAFEIGFVFLDQVLRRNRVDENIAKQITVLRAEVGRAIPDVAVQKDSPTYDLQEAARALTLGGETRAWELTQPRLALLKKHWAELDPRYVVWAADQMRKQKQLKDALEMCFTMLLRELDLDPEVAAGVILVKGDTYSDMQNFQAARIEYEGLKNNKRYTRTEAGSRAKYRLVSLLIQTKDYSRAEELLQILVDSDNVETQAEAYFLQAKMAYDQQQYEEARKYLNEVFKRKLDHVEGKLLEGELRLLVRGGLASTEVEAGTPELGTVAIPGLPLTLKLQDQNLAISQGGAAVKVLVRTSKGGDEERISLHVAPGTRDVFSATIATMLGKIAKGDMTLQLRGDDTVTYVIDPEYQKAHGLNYTPKTLAVRYDPRLIASSGEILNEEEQEKREMERRARAAETLESMRFMGRDERTVRPGSPIYAQVTDLAQDVTDEADTVHVNVNTASGDMLQNIALKETGPHTGVFRGQIPTAIPLPRVSVSDTQEGKLPGIVIREGNQEVWSSLADGVKPKWIEVDTMSSYLVKSVAIQMPDPKQVKQVVLQGLLADQYNELAAYPPRATLGGGGGLRGEYFGNRTLSGPILLTRVDAVLNYPGGPPAAKIPQENHSVRWTGRLVPAYSEEYTIHTISDDGVRLWINHTLLIDNWTDHGPMENTAQVKLEAGQQAEIKIEYYQGQGNGMFQLLWSSPKQKRELIPAVRMIPSGGAELGAESSVRLKICSGVAGSNPAPEAIRGYLKTQNTTTRPLDGPVFDRAETPFRGRQGWMTNRLTGVFSLDADQEMEFRFQQDTSPKNWQTAYLLIDDQMVLGGTITNETIKQTKKQKLTGGPHRLELLVQDHWENSKVVVAWRKDGAEFAPMPADLFSPAKHPEIQPFLFRGSIEVTPTGLKAVLTEPERLRKVRWLFEDFSGNAIAVQSISLVDSKDAVILPAKTVGGAGANKEALEVAPGDQIEVSYESERRLRDDTPVLTSMLNSSFYNGTIMFANEIIRDDPEGGQRHIEYQPARRCRPGDALVVIVQDNDADLTDERDVVPVSVVTTSGARLDVKALETQPRNPSDEVHCRHSGFFLARVKTGTQAGADTIPLLPGDMLTASFIDQENTNPGIPFERTYSVEEAGSGMPEMVIYRTRTELVEDTGLEAKTKLERLKIRGVATEGMTILKTRIVATHPDALKEPPKEGSKEPVPVDAGSPILFEAIYPRGAIHSGSVLKAQAVTETELKAAAAEKRDPKMLDVPMTIIPIESLSASKGYPIQLQRPFARNAKDMLQEGCFSGIIRLQIGSPGDPVDDMVIVGLGEFESREELNRTDGRYRIPTLLVSGSETVHLRIKDEEKGGVSEQLVRLLSDARLEVMDSTYTAPQEAIHLGETFYLRLTDPDQDTSDGRDKVVLNAKAASGGQAQVEMNETLPHSGIFTAMLKPVFSGAAPAQAGGPDAGALKVKFGDEVVLQFQDQRSLSSPDGQLVEKKTKIHFGADGELAAFTKVFADPEMAVKTRFLMAEALFEMAKEHRKLKQEETANEEITRGKRILEEAMRDYPNTSLVAQGEFLLANLAQEQGNPQEAVSRYASVINQWPDSEYAVRSQFKMALCQEKMGNFDQACENYVRVIYLYPDSELVADARIRLGNYYYKDKQYKVAARIFVQFQKASPAHPLASKTLFLAGQCHIKVEDWKSAIETFDLLITQYPDQKQVRAEAMYWLADCQTKAKDFRQAYRTFKKLTWDYPESKWAKIARGRLTEETFANIEEEDGAGGQ